jgi:hypothetical protein
VVSPRPEGSEVNATVYPIGGVNIVRSGGQIAFDHRGGPNGGIEVAFWDRTPPDGSYGIGVQDMSGVAVDAIVDVFLNGQRVPITTSEGRVDTARVPPLPPGSDLTGRLAGSVRIFSDSSSGPTAPAAVASRAPAVKRAASVSRTTPAKPVSRAAAAPARQPRAAETKRR